jgi:hypothetical protein
MEEERLGGDKVVVGPIAVTIEEDTRRVYEPEE